MGRAKIGMNRAYPQEKEEKEEDAGAPF